MERKTFGKRIARRRRELNLSQAELAKALNIPQSRVSEIEQGTRKIDAAEELPLLAEALQCSIGALFGEDIPPASLKEIGKATKLKKTPTPNVTKCSDPDWELIKKLSACYRWFGRQAVFVPAIDALKIYKEAKEQDNMPAVEELVYKIWLYGTTQAASEEGKYLKSFVNFFRDGMYLEPLDSLEEYDAYRDEYNKDEFLERLKELDLFFHEAS